MKDQKQLTNFTHNIETIGPNVNSKKQQKQKINNIYNIIHYILFYSYKTTGFRKSLILRDSTSKKCGI